MVIHMWGDGFDFNTLREAERFIVQYVNDNSECYLSSKEKYGIIRYEFLCPKDVTIEYGSEEDMQIKIEGKRVLYKAVHLAVKKYPSVKQEILEDFNLEYI